MSLTTEFELSRVYGRGWNAGKKALSEVSVDLDKIEIDKINPYETPEARERWASGFSEALSTARGISATRMRRAPPAQVPDTGKVTSSSRHRFRLGQLVTLSATIFERTSPDAFKISRLLPIEHGVAQYRVTSVRDNHERVVEEARLAPRS
jgi:hypothetical protein